MNQKKANAIKAAYGQAWEKVKGFARTPYPIGQFLSRFKVAFKILINPKSRWVVIFVSEEGFRSLLTGDGDVDVKMSYHRMQEYNMWHLIRSTGNTKDDVDMMLAKAEFEAKAQEYADKTKKP